MDTTIYQLPPKYTDDGVDGDVGTTLDGSNGKKNGIHPRLRVVRVVLFFKASAMALAPSSWIALSTQMLPMWLDRRGLKSGR